MFYFWFIPVAVGVVIIVWLLYARFRNRAKRAAGGEEKSPLDRAKEQEASENAQAGRHHTR